MNFLDWIKVDFQSANETFFSRKFLIKKGEKLIFNLRFRASCFFPKENFQWKKIPIPPRNQWLFETLSRLNRSRWKSIAFQSKQIDSHPSDFHRRCNIEMVDCATKNDIHCLQVTHLDNRTRTSLIDFALASRRNEKTMEIFQMQSCKMPFSLNDNEWQWNAYCVAPPFVSHCSIHCSVLFVWLLLRQATKYSALVQTTHDHSCCLFLKGGSNGWQTHCQFWYCYFVVVELLSVIVVVVVIIILIIVGSNIRSLSWCDDLYSVGE